MTWRAMIEIARHLAGWAFDRLTYRRRWRQYEARRDAVRATTLCLTSRLRFAMILGDRSLEPTADEWAKATEQLKSVRDRPTCRALFPLRSAASAT